MSQILALPEKAGLKDILALVASCEELVTSLLITIPPIYRTHRVITSPLRASEKAPLRVLAKHTEIRFPVKKVETSGDKMMLLIQVCVVSFAFLFFTLNSRRRSSPAST